MILYSITPHYPLFRALFYCIRNILIFFEMSRNRTRDLLLSKMHAHPVFHNMVILILWVKTNAVWLENWRFERLINQKFGDFW